jgi:hypothetical protein
MRVITSHKSISEDILNLRFEELNVLTLNIFKNAIK